MCNSASKGVTWHQRRGRSAESSAHIRWQLPQGYTLDWGGEYSEYVAAQQSNTIMYWINPLAILLIFMILFALYGNFKFPVTVVIGVVMTEPVGALIALKLTHTPFSVISSALGLLALMGVSVWKPP